MAGLDWRLQGNCSTRTAEDFFPLSYGAAHTAAAVAICNRAGGCPVQAECLKWAVDNHVDDGVWGGRTAKEREKYGTGPMPERQPAEPKPETKAAKRRGPRSYTCSKGHRKTEDSRGKWICKRCSHDRLVAWREEQAAQVSA